ncbi:hypothetical protein Tco_1203625 [Tanacetum coccineum]
MAESSSHNPSLPKITPKEEPVTLDKPESLNPFLLADQIEFTFEEIAFTTNNEEAFTRAPTQYKEYLCEFWYTAKTLDDSKIWVSTPTGGIREDIGYSREIGAKGTLKKSFLPPRPPFTDHMKAICNLDVHVDSKSLKPSSQTEEVPQGKKLGAKSGLKRKQSSKYTSESNIEASKSKTGQSEKETQSSSAKDKSPSHPSPPTPVVGEMHKEVQQAAGGPTSLGATSKEGARPQLSSADSTAEADSGNSAPNDSIPSQQDQTKSVGDGLKTAHTDSGTNEESRADEISKKIKLEDLSDLLKDTRSAFFTPDSSQDEPIIVSDESEEEEEVDKDKDTHATSHDIPKDTLIPHPPSPKSAQIQELMAQARPSYPDINQLTDLLVTSLKPKFSKLLASHDFASCLPNALKELPSKFTELSGDIKELKKHVQDIEIELPGDLKEIPIKLETFTSTILVFHPRFATMVENASGATRDNVPSAGQASTSPAEGEKNTTKDAETNLQN